MELREIRKTLKIKQTHAAEICRTNQAEYSKMETGKIPWRQKEFSGRLLSYAVIPMVKLEIQYQGI